MDVLDVELPAPQPNQVVVRHIASGVCHSQLHYIFSDRATPGLIGHEATGVVEAIGSNVSHVAVGDEVFVTWLPRAPLNPYREHELTTLDVGGRDRAEPENVFTWATHEVTDGMYVVKAPVNSPLATGSIVGCAVMTGAGAVINSANVQPGETVAVWGVGGVGLSAIAAARVAGAGMIIAVDLDDAKLNFADGFGATHLVNARSEDAVEAVRSLTPGSRPSDLGGVDYAFDCIGKSLTIQQVIAAVRSGHWGETRGGTALLVGVPTEDVLIDPLKMLAGEKRFHGSLGGSCVPEQDFPTFIDWYHKGDLDLDALVTERVKIDDINEVVAELRAGRVAGRAIIDFA